MVGTRLVWETGKPIASERAELDRLRKAIIEPRMQRDVLERSVVLWVDEATGR